MYHKNDIKVCNHQELEKTATVTVVLLCCSLSVLSHGYALNACYWRFANWASIGYRLNGIRTTGAESTMPTWYPRYPVARGSIRHASHIIFIIRCSDSGDGGCSNGRRSGVDDWLVVTSISVPVAVVFGRHLESLGVNTHSVADCLQKLQPEMNKLHILL